MSQALDTLAERYGIAVRYTGLDGVEHLVPDTTKLAVLEAMGLGVGSEAAVEAALAAAPAVPQQDGAGGASCYVPDWLERQGCWGISLQLYALRSQRNWGIGDFADLAAVAATAAAAGADFIGVNPLHATFLSEPDRRSPFFPSTRRFLNPLYIAVDEVPGFRLEAAEAAALAVAREGDLVDYHEVSRLKLAALRRTFLTWLQERTLAAQYDRDAFDAFVQAGGEMLRRHALFEALAAKMAGEGRRSRWDEWPAELQAVESPAVARFADEHADDIAFHLWLQWLASVQLQAAQDAALANGMRIGLYLDFAVGEAPDGSATWGAPTLAMRGVHIGAPPDYFSTVGQDWGIAPLSPTELREDPEAAYGEMIAGSMRYGGALRIDHAMGIRQLFLVPRGSSAAAGSYVRYPMPQMLQALAAASHAHRTIVIGEDLGYVPEGFRELMSAVRMLSYRILYFERGEQGFLQPSEYPREALACVSTHDLPTIEGWWRGADVALRLHYELIDREAATRQALERVAERNQLLDILVGNGLLDGAQRQQAEAAALGGDAPLPPSLVVALHRFLARTPSRLVAVRLEDLAGEMQPVNLPGTVDEYPNWQRKLGVSVEQIADLQLFRAVAQGMAAERARQA